MDNMGGIFDGQGINKAIKEVIAAFEEAVTIKKWTSNATELPAEGTTPAGVYTLIPSTAVIDDIGIEKTTGRDGVYAAGDLQFQLRVAMTAPTANPYHPGDRIIYDGVEYNLVQKPQIEYLDSIVYYTCIGRRISD